MPSAIVRVLLFPLAFFAAALAAGCSDDGGSPAPPAQPPPEDEPPPFNAVDPSLVCPAGQVGWDFSTGGGINGEPFSSVPVRGVRIQKAWYAHNCTNASTFDYTASVASSCNGKDTCDWSINWSSDPAKKCEKNALIEWKCGIESPTYSIGQGGEAKGKTLSVTCGAPISIASATFGYNCPGVTEGAHTDKIGAVCNDTRRCTFNALSTIGDPAAGCAKKMRVQYRCGSDSTLLTFEGGEGDNLFACPVEPPTDSPLVTLTAATWGQECSDGLTSTQQAAQLAAAKTICNGKVACAVLASNSTFGDPKPGCGKTLNLSYRCGSSPGIYKVSAIDGQQALATCVTEATIAGEGIKIVKAQFGDSCGPLNGAGNNETAQVNASCSGKNTCTAGPTGKVPEGLKCRKNFTVTYQCGSDPTKRTASIAADATGKTTTLECPAAINIRSATYGSKCGQSALEGNATTALKTACDGTRGGCDFKVSTAGTLPNTCTKNFVATYTCGLDATLLTTKKDGDASAQTVHIECPIPGPVPTLKQRKECIPATCDTGTVRDADLKCVPGSAQALSESFTLMSLAATRTQPDLDLDDKVTYADVAYTISGSFQRRANLRGSTFPALHTQATWWTTDVYRKKGATTGESDVEGFNCVVATVPIDAGSQKIDIQYPQIPASSNMINPDCFLQQSWGDAANRAGMTETAFRAAYDLNRRRSRVSFDPTGTVNNKSIRSKTPNPPGFFYNPSIPWVDMIKYYEQSEIKFEPTVLNFEPIAPRINIGLNSAKLNTSSVAIQLFSNLDGPALDIDFNWFAAGQNIMNPFGVVPGQSAIASMPRGFNMIDKKLRGEVFVYPMGRPTEAMLTTTSIGLPVSATPLANGTTESNKVSLSREVVEKMFDDASAGGWKADNTFGVKVCLKMDTATGASTTLRWCPAPLTVNGREWRMCIGGSTYCAEAGTFTIASRDAVQRPLEYQRPSGNVANTKLSSSGDGRVAGNGMNGQQNNCTKTGLTSKCTTVRSNDNQNTGSFSGTYFASNQESERAQDPTTSTASADMTAELKGFQIVDMMDADQTKTNKVKAGGGWEQPSITMKIVPPWDLLINETKTAAAASPAPIKPVVQSGRYANETGIGIGIAFETQMQFGPIPATVTATASAGVSLSLEFTTKYTPTTPYPCVGGNRGEKCFKLNTTKKSQSDAQTYCASSGGRLAEMISAADLTAIKTAATPAKESVWIGGQSSFEFPSSKCSRPESKSDKTCNDKATVWYRWIGSDKVFGYIDTNNITKYYGDKVATGTIGFKRQVPTATGMALTTTWGLEDKPQTDSKQFVCEYDAAKTATYEGYEVRLNLGAGAGLGLDVCSPSSKIGICLGVSFNFIDVSLKPGLTYDAYALYDQNSLPLGARSNTVLDAPWNLTLMSGDVKAHMQLLLFSIDWTVAYFSGFKVAGGNLFKYTLPARQDY